MFCESQELGVGDYFFDSVFADIDSLKLFGLGVWSPRYKDRMNGKPKDSDWKQYRDMIEFLRERYLKETNQRLCGILTDGDRLATDQFWDAFEEMKKEKKILQDCLDPAFLR
ncbi:MAG: hypothetical protein GVY36_18665 [Verrucomicrobia bacterium]|jgi:hypothetical protein|nr:hypothetical protein [Verrucomicrobiota bacterium]